jgi:hypothetical protein
MINTIECIRDLAIPRMSGSEGEKKTQLQLFNYLKKVGISPKAENFTYNTGLYANLRTGFIIALVYNLVNILCMLISLPVIQLILLFVFIILEGIILFQILHWTSILRKTTNLESKNIIGEKLCQKQREFKAPMATIILIAHYDSISYRFDLKIHHFLLISTIIGELSIVFLSIFIVIFNQNIHQSIIGTLSASVNGLLSGVISVELGLLLINVVGNYSSGAIDNATGCTAIIKILDHLKELKSDLEWCDLRILFSGAYEWGIWGAQSYLSTHREELACYKDIFVINLDSLAIPLQILHKKKLHRVNPPNTILYDLVLHEAHRIHRSIISNQKQLLLWNDYFPFLKIGCELVSIQSNAPLIHTQADRLDRVDIKVVEDIVEIFVNVLPLLDQWIGDKIRSAE